MINSYDLDGVIFFDVEGLEGVTPTPLDIIVTGRSFEEAPETVKALSKRGIGNKVYFSPTPFSGKTRPLSGRHKGETLRWLMDAGERIGVHFEDDPIQAEEIRKLVPEVQVVLLVHSLTEKENVRRESNP